MKKYLLTAGCGFALLVVSSCNKEEIGAYTPIPKLHLGEPFTYKCDVSNYVQLEYDSLGQAAILNFYKEEITELDDVHYDEHTCTFSFHKGEKAKYKISWDYTSRLNVIRFLYGQNGMWYRMNNDKNEYILTANDGMTVRVVAYRANYDSLSFTINNFCIEEYND